MNLTRTTSAPVLTKLETNGFSFQTYPLKTWVFSLQISRRQLAVCFWKRRFELFLLE